MILEFLKKVITFEKEAHNILSLHETSKSRIILIEDTYNSLGSLSIKQDELFRQALRCIENKLFRAAHVMAWAAFMDFIEEKVSSDNFHKINSIRPKWKIKNIESFL